MDEAEIFVHRSSTQLITKEILSYVELMVALSVAFISVLCLDYMNQPVRFCLVPILILVLKRLLISAKRNWILSMTRRKDTIERMLTIQNLCDYFSILVMIFSQKCEFIFLTMILVLIPVLIDSVTDSDKHKIQKYFHQTIILFRIDLTISLSFYGLKTVSEFSINWVVIMMPIMLSLFSFSIINLLMFIFFFFVDYSNTFENFEMNKWHYFIHWGISSNCALLLYYSISLTTYLDTPESSNLSIPTTLFLLHNISTLGIIYIYKEKFINWLVLELEYPVVSTTPKYFARVSEDFSRPITEEEFEERLEEKTELEIGVCKICYENVVNAVLIPCGHGGICYDCSFSLKLRCPICRKRVKEVLKAQYFSAVILIS